MFKSLITCRTRDLKWRLQYVDKQLPIIYHGTIHRPNSVIPKYTTHRFSMSSTVNCYSVSMHKMLQLVPSHGYSTWFTRYWKGNPHGITLKMPGWLKITSSINLGWSRVTRCKEWGTWGKVQPWEQLISRPQTWPFQSPRTGSQGHRCSQPASSAVQDPSSETLQEHCHRKRMTQHLT
jgi:hypothetical protein